MKNGTIEFAGEVITPGTIKTILLPSSDLYTQTRIDIPVHVFHGKKNGPRLFIVSSIHGDELNGIEIIRRLHMHHSLKNVHGTLITIPVVNIHGFLLRSRYLPDRRDLNRSFPGNPEGSLAARLANILMEEVVRKCHYGIDLHTGAHGRINMPQIRANLDTPGTEEMARAFEVPVILDAKVRDGSLRGAASELGIPLLVYEGGECLRYNELSIRTGVRGILKVLSHFGMITLPHHKQNQHMPVISQTARWARAHASGLLQPIKEISKTVNKNEALAIIHDPFLMKESQVITAPFDGIIIGRANIPLVNMGDAVYNIASIKKLKHVRAYIEELHDEITGGA